MPFNENRKNRRIRRCNRLYYCLFGDRKTVFSTALFGTFVNKYVPNSLSLLISSILIIGVLFLLGNVVAQNIELMRTNAPS